MFIKVCYSAQNYFVVRNIGVGSAGKYAQTSCQCI